MRELTSHKGGALNDSLTIEVLGDAGTGAPHHYIIVEPNGVTNTIVFHTGDPANGINGISNEALLAIVEDRLEGFQAGPFACDENYWALGYVRSAMTCLLSRTKQRQARGVEGQATP